MKRIFFLYCFGFLCVSAPYLHAERWGGMGDFVQNKTAPYAMNLLIDAVPIRYAVSDEITPREERIFWENMQKWPQTVLQTIQENKREDEFKDIVPLLARPLLLEQVEENPHVKLTIGHKVCGSSTALGCFSDPLSDTPAQIVIERKGRALFKSVSLHEIGHFYGLGDQYKAGLFNAHEEYSSDVNTQQGSVMNEENSLTCDDVDGFINLLDLRLAQYNNHQFSVRAQNGWKTFCPDSENFYVESRTVNRRQTGYIVRDVPWHKNLLIMSYDYGKANINMINRLAWTLPFYIEENSLIARDEETGLITSVETLVRHRGDKPHWWKREFNYASGKHLAPEHILITDRIDDFVTTCRVKIGKDRTARGKNFLITPRIYKESIYNYQQKSLLTEAVRIHHTEGMVDTFEIENPRKDASLFGSRKPDGTFAFRARVRGKKLTCPGETQPEGDCAKLADLWEHFRFYANNLESFYKNFYDPLKQKKLEEKVIKELQKALRLPGPHTNLK